MDINQRTTNALILGAENKNLSQCKAMLLAGELGEKLISEHPEIADEYRGGKTYKKLAKEYLRGYSKNVGIAAVGKAIRGLIPKKKREAIDNPRRKKICQKLGKKMKKVKKGIFGMTEKEKTLALQKSGRELTLAMGRIPYDDQATETGIGVLNEAKYIESLAMSNEFSTAEITKLANEIFGNNRTEIAIIGFINRLRQKQKN